MATRRRRKVSDPGMGISLGGSVIRRSSRKADILDTVARADESRQAHLDTTGSVITSTENAELQPLYSFGLIDRVFKQSNVLPQCINAMLTNIAGWGYKVVALGPEIEIDPSEAEMLETWIARANVDESLMQIARRQVFFYEKYGFAGLPADRLHLYLPMKRLREAISGGPPT